MKIIKVVIKGTSGYCAFDEAYEDKITIEENKISYNYKPMCETEINPVRVWSYKTNSPVYQKLFSMMTEVLPELLGNEDDILRCCDIGSTEFIITYEDKSKAKYLFWCPPDVFEDCFSIVKQMVPGCEYMPVTLMTSEDFEDEE